MERAVPLVTPEQAGVLLWLDRLLTVHNIAYQITGGLAAIAHGARRPLFDVDIDVSRADLEAVRDLLRPHLVDDIYRLRDENFDLTLLTAAVEGVTVDVSQAEDAYYRDLAGGLHRLDADLGRSVRRRVAGIYLPVIDRDDLIAYKRIIGRPTDLVDVEQILAADRAGDGAV